MDFPSLISSLSTDTSSHRDATAAEQSGTLFAVVPAEVTVTTVLAARSGTPADTIKNAEIAKGGYAAARTWSGSANVASAAKVEITALV